MWGLYVVTLNKMNQRNLPSNILGYVRRLEISSGDHLGELVEVLPWQERFIRGVFRPKIQTAAMSIARGNGKTTLVSWLAGAVVDGPLNHRNAKVVVACASHEQGRGIHKAVVDLIPDAKTSKQWSVWTNNRYRIVNNDTGAELIVLGMNPGTSHGLIGATLLLADEVAQWPKNRRAEMWNALTTTLGKSPGCRLVALGTRPDDSDNPFTKLLDGEADFVAEYRSRAKKTWHSDAAIRAANPSLDHFPALRQVIERERREARRDPVRLAAYRAYRLNQGTSELELRDVLIDAGAYEGLETETAWTPGAAHGLGIDLSGGHAWSAAAAVSLEAGGLVDGMALWPSTVDVKDRSKAEGIDYGRMIRAGDLLQIPGPTVSADDVVAEAFDRWGRPVFIVADHYRRHELEHHLEAHGYSEDAGNLVFRRMGWQDGGEDLRAFRRLAAAGEISFRTTLLMRESFAAARTTADTVGNEKMAKETERSTRGRDDVAAAAVIASGEVERREREPQGQGARWYGDASAPTGYGMVY
ncbi:MAG: hypothetical protein F4Z29_01235 [Gemmatimonadetes bacterium]|nr:hypothetical protein [Gemmatimonadota bacterium]